MLDKVLERYVLQSNPEHHFKLKSGKHSDTYIKLDSLIKNPEDLQTIVFALADLAMQEYEFDAVAGLPFLGNHLACMIGFVLGKKFYPTKEENGVFEWERFKPSRGEKILIVDDVFTTGKSVEKFINCLGIKDSLAALVCIVDRSSSSSPAIPYKSLRKIKASTYQANSCPLCKQSRAVNPKAL